MSRALAECLEAAKAGAEALRLCLQGYPEPERRQLAAMISLADAVRSENFDPQPSPEWIETTRARLALATQRRENAA